MKNFFSFYLNLVRTSIRASISVRGAFLLESALMVANNLIFVFIWWIFFRQFKEIAGWTMRDLIILNAIGMGAYGLMLICFGGIKFISKIILNGDLDPFMTQPKNLLIHLVSSKSQSKGWGYLMTTVALIGLGGLATFPALPLIGLGVVSRVPGVYIGFCYRPQLHFLVWPCGKRVQKVLRIFIPIFPLSLEHLFRHPSICDVHTDTRRHHRLYPRRTRPQLFLA